MEKNIFIFDQNKCVGCHACVIACINENDFQTSDQWRNVHNSNNPHFPHLPLFYLSLACNHCDDAPCLKNCPALAYSRDEKTGAIIHHPEKCIGCKFCTWACPYDAPKFNTKTRVIEKCTFCYSRILEDLKPACANLCPVGALDFTHTEFTREESIESSPVQVNVGSNIKINKLRNKSPEIDNELFNNQPNNLPTEKRQSKISVKEEWPLLVFTLFSALLVALYASEETDLFNSTGKFLYMGFGASAAMLSMLHLGQKTRVFRSMMNLKNSWLSKEIFFFVLFFSLVCCDFYIIDLPNYIITIIGVCYLFSIDMLYMIATWEWSLKIHSAQTILIGISFFAFFTNWNYLFVFILSLRLTLYIYRKYEVKKDNLYLSILRILLPLLSFIVIYSTQEFIIALALLLLGEIIDRIEFYNELHVPYLQKELNKQKIKS